MKTNDFIAPIEWDILNDYGFQRTDGRHIDCPICEGKKKFRLNEYNGRAAYICVCSSGGALDLIGQCTGMDFKDVAAEIDKKYGNVRDEDFVAEPKNNTFDFGSLNAAKETQVEKYLNSRDIMRMPTNCMRIECNVWHSDLGRHFDVMCCAALNHRNELAYIHRTFLENGKKINSDSAKKIETVVKSDNVAVKLFPNSSHLGVSEGIESALSAAQVYKVNTWALLNTAFMKKFRAPIGVKTLTVYADNDCHGAGLAAAFECANKNLMCKNDVSRVIVKWPQKGDFNDHLKDPGKVFEWELTR